MFGHCAGHTNWWYGPWTYFHGTTGIFLNFLFWAFVILLFVWLFQLLFRSKVSNGGSYTANNSLNILSERYARGEINKEEFDRMKKDLT